MENSDDFFPLDIIHLLPVNHRFYFYLGVTKLMEFPDIADHLVREFNKKAKYRSFVENTGIEPLKDIQCITISNNKKDENDENHDFMAAVHSRCDKEKLLSHFEKNDDIPGELYVSIDSENPLYLLFAEEYVLVFSNSARLMEDIVAQKKSPGKEKESCVLSHFVEKETIFGIGTVIEREKKDQTLFNIPFNIFKSMQFVSLFVHQDGEDFIVTVHLIYSDKEYVELVSGLVKGIIGILARQVEYEEVKEFLEGIRIEEELEGLKLVLRLSKKNLDRVFTFLKEKEILDKKRPVTDKDDQSKPDRSFSK